MCMHCSVRCSKCKPAEMVGVICDDCGKTNLLTRKDCLYALGYTKAPKGPNGEDLGLKHYTCKYCGADLSPEVKGLIKPEPCLYSKIICGYPCGRRFRERKGNAEICKKQVFAGKLPQEDSENALP